MLYRCGETLEKFDAPQSHSDGCYFWRNSSRSNCLSSVDRQNTKCRRNSIRCYPSTFLVVYNNRRARSVVKQVQHNVLNQRIEIKSQSNSAVKVMIIGTSVFLLCYGLLLRCSISVLHDNNDCNDFHYKMPLRVVNSGINPLAYVVFKRDIKAELERVFKKRQ